MRVILKGFDNDKSIIPEITANAEGLLIVPKDGQTYEINCDKTDYTFINMDEVVSVQIKLKEEDELSDYSIGDFIDDLSKNWSSLDDSEREYVSFKVARARNSAKFYEILDRLANESSGVK